MEELMKSLGDMMKEGAGKTFVIVDAAMRRHKFSATSLDQEGTRSIYNIPPSLLRVAC